MGTTKKRNHYLPRAYLRGFCDRQGLLWSFDRRSKEYRRLSPDSAAVEKEFYIVKDATGRKSNAIEDWLAQCENAAIPVWTGNWICLNLGQIFRAEDNESTRCRTSWIPSDSF